MVDKDACRLYELFAAPSRRRLDGRLGRDLEPALERAPPRRLDQRRRGRPADPARARPLRRGRRRRDPHALRFTAADDAHARTSTRPATTRRADGASLPPMGLRVRLKANVDISGFGPQAG